MLGPLPKMMEFVYQSWRDEAIGVPDEISLNKREIPMASYEIKKIRILRQRVRFVPFPFELQRQKGGT